MIRSAMADAGLRVIDVGVPPPQPHGSYLRGGITLVSRRRDTRSFGGSARWAGTTRSRNGNLGMAKLALSDPIRVVGNSPNLRELTTRVLRNAILNMHFKPNERLVERRLCEQIGVSRTCVREALRHLETEGLVEHVPNRGLFVATVSVDEARQIYEVRAALESTAGRMFVERATDEHLDALKTAFLRI